MSIHEQYTVVLHGADGNDYVLVNDGGSGPMSTGSDEWTRGSIYSLKGMTRERAESIMENPDRGWGKTPDGHLVMYRLILNKVGERIIDRNERERLAQEAEERRAAVVRVAALGKLTAEEREILGL